MLEVDGHIISMVNGMVSDADGIILGSVVMQSVVIKDTFVCRGDCDDCGICQVYRGKEAAVVYDEYIEGKKSFQEITEKYRR